MDAWDYIAEQAMAGEIGFEQTVEVSCPTCGEMTGVQVEAVGDGQTQASSDCQVCCRPFNATVTVRGGQVVAATASSGW
ncbi:MAG: hypothetical protein ACI9MR_001613 [Myxococcota bacterium]|jgi:hypothetical protein